jgi:hypothetical protein
MIYAKRALEIFRDKGPIELSKRIARFLFSHPLRLLDPYHHRRFKFQTWKNDLQNRIRYDAPPDPYQPIFIRPRQIQNRKLIPKFAPRFIGLGAIKQGDWDSKKYDKPVDKLGKITYFAERFEQNKKQKETYRYKQLLTNSNTNKKYKLWGFETAEDFVSEYCNNYDELFRQISDNGYRKKYENPSPMSTLNPNRADLKLLNPILRDQLEVLVVIDREGIIHLWDGHHRFGIARVLKLGIPANVLCRHKQWQKLRDEIHNNGLPEEYEELRDHPDLQDVLH